MEAVMSTDFADRVVPVPTLVVGGLGDQIFGPEALRDGVVAPLPGARLELLDCGHEIPLERPRELAELIQGFVTDLDQAAPEEACPALDAGISQSELRPAR
jgi:pimeloyl-ACP methyl ester carboxylesterase